MNENHHKKCGLAKDRIFLCLFCVFFVPLLEYKNKKRVTAVTQYLVNLKSNTMKNTHANVERICESHKLFLKKMLILKIL